MWRVHARVPALYLSPDRKRNRRDKVAALGLLHRDPNLPRLSLPRSVARLRGGTSGCLSGPAVVDQRGFECGRCHAFLHSLAHAPAVVVPL